MKKFAIVLLLVGLLTALAPIEKTLGVNARVVYLHGAWVWAALAAFLAAGFTGLLGLLARRQALHAWSQAMGRTGIFFWVTFLPMSLYVMQANWNGLFLDEPRFRIPLDFAIVGLLLQVGLSFLPQRSWTSLANLLYGAAIFASVTGAEAILHPDSPIFNSDSKEIQLFFAALLFLLLAAAGLLALALRDWEARRSQPPAVQEHSL